MEEWEIGERVLLKFSEEGSVIEGVIKELATSHVKVEIKTESRTTKQMIPGNPEAVKSSTATTANIDYSTIWVKTVDLIQKLPIEV